MERGEAGTPEPDLIVAGIATLESQEGGGMEEKIAQAERDLRSIQMEEDRAIRLFVSGRSPRPNSTSNVSSSPSGLRAPERSWTITVLRRRVELRSGD